MADWTPERVEDRLVEAADVLKRLPEEKVQGFFNVWPEVARDFADMVGAIPQPMRRPPPSAAAISRMEETLTWIRFLAPEDGKLLWARAEGAPWKAICWRFGVSRATAHRRWQYGLSVIALRLDGRRVPAKRSQSFVVDRAARLSR
ncbi:hypothetical protein TH8_08820 [Thalassospira profundimaris]|uniref:DUF6362 family protein n=1 Tax=Thalassospira TaxID=168934 RepID=UPI0002872902|nr:MULTISPECIES: DUF6362 family protein [Thalassospira]EKF09292.1 hypothetical protein TH2_05358 [Thalassospira profundimaris WP0211]MBC06197.1 hypothetical protein [Thalassospira sp.]RCK26793.1 hypothetical protein TH8_08820 [Thalassospira profundimaris]|tara:strand:- start:3586 stop:4023 length:438 start_codon:yes stop_codon:yes gene_type:complete